MYDGGQGAGPHPGGPSAERPSVGAGNTLAVTYRDARGEEAYLAKPSGPGLPAPFWQVWEELQRIGVPAASVTAVHSELEPCRLPGCYCDPLLRRFGFPGAEISFGQPYGTTPGSVRRRSRRSRTGRRRWRSWWGSPSRRGRGPSRRPPGSPPRLRWTARGSARCSPRRSGTTRCSATTRTSWRGRASSRARS
ncbi:nucleic acid/nucleotide deaminase domain-containing protein [Actinomadura yumaensis]|uniref:nucleic acid/nucleotide deaminase domain-containing protein n=1 Tax=Actinomadura yumaensis TaxID=111807 RepID=UPI00360A56CC